MREDGADADGVFVTPVHAGLFAASDDQDSGGGFDMPGGDEEAGLARLVAPVSPLNGRWSFAGCAADGCLRTYEVLHRGHNRAGRDAIEALERGDVVRFKSPVLLGDGLTYRASL